MGRPCIFAHVVHEDEELQPPAAPIVVPFRTHVLRGVVQLVGQLEDSVSIVAHSPPAKIAAQCVGERRVPQDATQRRQLGVVAAAAHRATLGLRQRIVDLRSESSQLPGSEAPIADRDKAISPQGYEELGRATTRNAQNTRRLVDGPIHVWHRPAIGWLGSKYTLTEQRERVSVSQNAVIVGAHARKIKAETFGDVQPACNEPRKHRAVARQHRPVARHLRPTALALVPLTLAGGRLAVC